jgi:hypothetical protein
MRRGNRIDAGLQRIERFNEGFGVRPDAGEFVQRCQHVERCGIAIGIFAGRKALGLLPPIAAGQVGDEFEQHVGRRRKRDAVGEFLAEGAVADRKVLRHVECRQHARDEIMIVGRENAEGIADDIIEIGASEIDVDMPGFFFRTGLVEPAAREEGGVHGIVAGAAGRSGVGRLRLSLGGLRLRRLGHQGGAV